ncbi:Melanoma-associated antigen 9 [Vulpes lagopus]
MKMFALLMFLLPKYGIKQPTTKVEMLEVITPEYQDNFPVILSQASRCMQLVFGLDVIEVDPSEHSYVLNPILGLTWDGMLSDQWGLPKTSLLGLVLGLILLQDDCATKEEVWEALGVTGVYDGQEYIVYGEPRDLLTSVWVQECYLQCRAYEETSKLQVIDYVLLVRSNDVRSSLAL